MHTHMYKKYLKPSVFSGNVCIFFYHRNTCCINIYTHYATYKEYNKIEIFFFFLVIDPQLLSEAGGDMLVAKIPSPTKVKQFKFAAGMFQELLAGSLPVGLQADRQPPRCNDTCSEDGVFKRTGLVLLVDMQTLDSSEGTCASDPCGHQPPW